jgi:hypothetical protein
MKDGPLGPVAVAILREGAVFGEVAGVADGKRILSATAVTAADVEEVAAEALAAMLHVTNRRQLATGTDGAMALRRNPLSRSHTVPVDRQPHARTAFSALRILPDSPSLTTQMPAHGVLVNELPFRIGRPAIDDEPPPPYHIHLSLEDERPFKISRLHFLIDETAEGPVIVDCASRLGTVVNGLFIHGTGHDAQAPLRLGTNLVVAGGRASQFRFKIVVLPKDR